MDTKTYLSIAAMTDVPGEEQTDVLVVRMACELKGEILPPPERIKEILDKPLKEFVAFATPAYDILLSKPDSVPYETSEEGDIVADSIIYDKDGMVDFGYCKMRSLTGRDLRRATDLNSLTESVCGGFDKELPVENFFAVRKLVSFLVEDAQSEETTSE